MQAKSLENQAPYRSRNSKIPPAIHPLFTNHVLGAKNCRFPDHFDPYEASPCFDLPFLD